MSYIGTNYNFSLLRQFLNRVDGAFISPIFDIINFTLNTNIMKTLITTSCRRIVFFILLTLTTFAKVNAQYYPDEEFDTTGIIVDMNTDGLDTV